MTNWFLYRHLVVKFEQCHVLKTNIHGTCSEKLVYTAIYSNQILNQFLLNLALVRFSEDNNYENIRSKGSLHSFKRLELGVFSGRASRCFRTCPAAKTINFQKLELTDTSSKG